MRWELGLPGIRRGERGGRRRGAEGEGGAALARPSRARGGVQRAVVAARRRREKERPRQRTCVCARVVMEAAGSPPVAKTPAPRRSLRPLLLPLLLFLLPAHTLRGSEAEERPRAREEECHFYAGGQVYPGEASRVSAADHSLHLSKAKSRWCSAEGG